MGTYGSSCSKGLEQSSLGIGLDDLVNGVLALRHHQLIAQTLANNLQDASAGDTVQDQLVVQRSSDELLLAVPALPDNEEVAGTGLSTLAILAVQPQDLVVAATTSIGGGGQRRAVVGTDLGIAEAANPGANHVLGRGVQTHAAGRAVELGHVGDDDVQHGLARSLDTELGLGANQSGTDVQIAAGLATGQPPGAIDREEGHDELLELGRVKERQGDAARREVHAGTVAVGTEDAQLSVVATVGLEALEALGGVVQNRGRGHEAQGAVGLDLGSGPASGSSPGGSEHVVSADGLVQGVGDILGEDGTRGLGEVVDELGGIEGSRRDAVAGLGRLGSLLDLDGGSRQVDILAGDSRGSHCAVI